MASVATNGFEGARGCELVMAVEGGGGLPCLVSPVAHGPITWSGAVHEAGAVHARRSRTMSETAVRTFLLTQPLQDTGSLPEDVIDMEVFEQLLEMDEDDQEFSRSLVWNYFEQAENTFEKMDAAM